MHIYIYMVQRVLRENLICEKSTFCKALAGIEYELFLSSFACVFAIAHQESGYCTFHRASRVGRKHPPCSYDLHINGTTDR